MEYLWTKGVIAPVFPTLSGDIATDVLIIGGGMAGILLARKLQEAGADYLLVEGKRIGMGITKGTTAVLTAQHDTLYQDIIRRFGRKKARRTLRANLRAVERFRALSRQIPCDFEERSSLQYALHDGSRLEREVAAVRSLGFPAEFTTETPLPFAVAGAVKYPGMAQFHPLKFLYGIAKDLSILENTFVTALSGTTALTSHGRIHAKKIILATHYPFLNRHGLYFTKLYQKRAYVVAYENAPDLGCTIEDSAKNGIFLRNAGGLLLVGGGGHRTGSGKGGFAIPREFAGRYFPEAREKYAWANQDCVSLDGVPYVGLYSKSTPDIYVASGFNLWGMTSSMVASELLTDLVLGIENHDLSAFAPQRSILRGQLFSNLSTTLIDFLTPSRKRCTHLGCTLKWNPAERSWDCPCHGSRFDENGRIIDGPAMKDSTVK